MKPPPTRPRWTTLAALIAAVLALHLLLLGQASPLAASPVPHMHSAFAPDTDTDTDRTADAPAERTAAPNGPPSAAPETSAPALRATLYTVRWISPPTPPTATPHSAGHSTPPRQPPVAPEAPPPANPQPRVHRTAQPAAPAHTPATALATPTVNATATEPEPASASNTPAAEANDRPAPETPALEDAPPSDAPATMVALLTTPTPAPADTRPQAANPASPPTEAPTQRNAARTQALPPALPPASTQLRYDVNGTAKGLNYRASSTLDWTQAEGRYSARMEVRILLLGSRVQTSTGRVGASGLLPERFSDKTRSERAAHFDRTQQTIRFSNNQPDAVLQPGAQDRLSLFMQLAGLLQAQASAYPVGHVISLQVAGTGDAEVWRFRVGPEETLTLPAGALRARRLMREPREPHDSQIDLWLAPELGHLPVRIRITQDNGDRVDQQLSQRP